MKTFSHWTTAEVVREFNLYQDIGNPDLKEWTTAATDPTPFEQQLLDLLQNRLRDRIYAWNEYDLESNFIGPILSIVDFNQRHYHSFRERELSVTYKDERLYGLVDLVVADGDFVPERPYFFLNEYKRELHSSNDPLGQLLIAMVVAQMLNEHQHPIHGAYVRGRYWHFVLLDGTKYAVHDGFNALTADLFKILGVLKDTKAIINKLATIDTAE